MTLWNRKPAETCENAVKETGATPMTEAVTPEMITGITITNVVDNLDQEAIDKIKEIIKEKEPKPIELSMEEFVKLIQSLPLDHQAIQITRLRLDQREYYLREERTRLAYKIDAENRTKEREKRERELKEKQRQDELKFYQAVTSEEFKKFREEVAALNEQLDVFAKERSCDVTVVLRLRGPVTLKEDNSAEQAVFDMDTLPKDLDAVDLGDYFDNELSFELVSAPEVLVNTINDKLREINENGLCETGLRALPTFVEDAKVLFDIFREKQNWLKKFCETHGIDENDLTEFSDCDHQPVKPSTE